MSAHTLTQEQADAVDRIANKLGLAPEDLTYSGPLMRGRVLVAIDGGYRFWFERPAQNPLRVGVIVSGDPDRDGDHEILCVDDYGDVDFSCASAGYLPAYAAQTITRPDAPSAPAPDGPLTYTVTHDGVQALLRLRFDAADVAAVMAALPLISTKGPTA